MAGGGQPGNQNARKGRPWQAALQRALSRFGEGDFERGLNPIADKVVAAAMEGDRDAWREIGDRLDGKAVQAIEGEIGVRHAFALPLGAADTTEPDEWAHQTGR